MQRVYTAPEPSMIHLLKDVLEERGIEAVVRGESLLGGAGELPPIETWVDLLVVNDDDAAIAERLIEETLQPAASKPEQSWTCPNCSEVMEPQFGVCWNCGTLRPD